MDREGGNISVWKVGSGLPSGNGWSDGLGPFEVVCGLVERFSSVSSWIDFDFYS